MEEIHDDQGGSQENGNKCLSGYSPRKCMSRYKFGKKVVKMISEVDNLLKQRERFDKDEMMLDKVWSSLQDQSVGIIGLYGMGGAGKTTLLKRIHSELGMREHRFDLVLWVVVSKDCDIGKVMDDIRKRLWIKDGDWSNSSEDQRVAKIYGVLKRKRFVLMLDDLCGKLELEKVGVPHPKETNCQSKVLLTTRYEDVCDKMQAQNKFKVECLLEKEAFDLFCKKVGEETLRCHGEIREIAREMSKECGGLPLAIITVGSAMAGVKSVEAWRQAIRDLSTSPWTALDLQQKVFRILEFSYDKLPDEAHKDCFLYSALYPEDYAIDVEDLIDRWIGEGFLGKSGKYKKSIYDMREEGRSIIVKLKLSCLLEDATNEVTYFVPSIKMHDVIRDMALWLARDQDENKHKIVVEEEVFALDSERLNVVKRILAMNVDEDWEVPNCPNLLTLSAHLGRIDFSKLYFCTRLRVLDLRNSKITHVPVEIGRLINLEFLNISGTRMSEKLPSEMKNLKKLRVLLMEGAVESLDKLPLEVLESLKQLKVFRYGGHGGGREEEEKEEMLVNRLERLPELEELGISLRTMGGLNKLLKSTKLRGCIRIFKLKGMQEAIEMTWLLASWSGMKHLERIQLEGLPNLMEVSSSIVTWHLSKLREVYIRECNSITHLTWLRYAPLLDTLAVTNCKSMEEVVRPGSDDKDLFSNLRFLFPYGLPKLKSIHNRALPFPSLKFIVIGDCPKLRKLPLNSDSAKDTLIGIYTNNDNNNMEWWNSLEWDNSDTEHLFLSKFRPR